MNKITKMSIIAIAVCLISVLTGCTDTINGVKTAKKGACALTGTVSLTGKSGATARSATTLFTGLTASNLSVSAYQSGGEKIYGTVQSDLSYSINITESGEWTVMAEYFASAKDVASTGALLSGTQTVTVKNGATIVTVPSIVISPCSNSDSLSSVSLYVVDQTGKVSYASAKAVQGDEVVDSGDLYFNDSLLSINMTDIPTGVYDVSFTFCDSVGNTLYSCREAITVFSGFTTDTWYGNAGHFTTQNDSTRFVITDELLSTYGTQVVPSTDMVLYGRYSDNSYNYYLTNDAKTPGDALTIDSTTVASNTNSFCFNSQGVFYALIHGEATATSGIYVSNGFSPAAFTFDNDNSFEAIACDMSNDMLYFKTGNTFFKCSHDKLSSLSETKISYEISLDFSTYNTVVETLPLLFAIYAQKVYMPVLYYKNNERWELLLITADLSEAMFADGETTKYTLTLTDSDVSVLDIPSFAESNSAAITDILYQDGAVYMLLREVSDSWSSDGVYSRGAVLKYDTVFKNTKYLGWTDTNAPNISSSDISYAYLFDESGNILYVSRGTETSDYKYTSDYIFLLENNGSKYLNYAKSCDSVFPSGVYAPKTTYAESAVSLSEDAFYGPSKFIAIKPKKLVIADDGYAVYVDENGALSYKNANRVVTLDLESFAITSIVTAGVAFDGDASVLTNYSTAFETDGSFYGPGSLYTKSGETVGNNVNHFAGIRLPE